MDDLAGIDWSKSATSQHRPAALANPPCPQMRPVPPSLGRGRNTPLPSQAPAGLSSSKTAGTKVAQDSFSNLVTFGPTNSCQNLTIAERQAQLEAEKRREEEERRRHCEEQFGSGQQWDALALRKSVQSPLPGQTTAPPNGTAADDFDLIAAFNKDTRVDNSSHYPPPGQISLPVEKQSRLDLSDPNSWSSNPLRHAGDAFALDDDDPFGLNVLNANLGPPVNAPTFADDDDFLGDLGKPVDEVRKKQQEAARPASGKPIDMHHSISAEDQQQPQRDRKDRRPNENDDAFDMALAQLLDYGFSPDQARRGLLRCGDVADAGAAANWLLDEAHGKPRQEPQQPRWPSTGPGRGSIRTDTWRIDERDEADFAMSATAMGNSLFKTANSLWRTGQKKLQRAVANFQHDSDPSQPKWMRQAQQGHSQRQREAISEQATDEALALEGRSWAKPSRTDSRQAQVLEAKVRAGSSRASSSGPPSSVKGRNSPAPGWRHRTASPAMSDARSRLNRLAVDDDTFSDHVRGNRPKKNAAATDTKRTDMWEPDLLGTEAPKPTHTIPHGPAQRSVPSGAMQPLMAPEPARARRRVPPTDAASLELSMKHQLDGTAHFKRGDFAMAHSSFSSSMSALPASHPLLIVLLTNRALTALKTGEPRQAVVDADEAVKLIGPGQGQGETVAVRGDQGQEESKDMKELYGKALSRKAEALEQLERWADAGATWQLCVEAGVSGSTAVKGRQRCQDALRPKPKPAPRAPRPRALAGTHSSEAVVRLREATRVAACEDDEKFALSDAVDSKVSAWRDGKRDNLRALLSSLDKVLWDKSGWRSVGMHELVMANKVKIIYMKAIAKTHPDKLPQDASTEIRLIAGLVFSTLNESWDKFKVDNGL